VTVRDDPARAGRENVSHYGPGEGSPGGWVLFATIVLCIAGLMRLVDSLWAFQYHGVLPENLEGAVFGHSLNTYGWVYLAVAVILIGSGLFVLFGSEIARWVGIVAAAIMVLSAMLWMPYYPVWSLVYIAGGSLVVYALAVHAGHEHRL
jgi:hypothetical protein